MRFLPSELHPLVSRRRVVPLHGMAALLVLVPTGRVNNLTRISASETNSSVVCSPKALHGCISTLVSNRSGNTSGLFNNPNVLYTASN